MLDERLGAARDHDVGLPERDLVGSIGDRLIRPTRRRDCTENAWTPLGSIGMSATSRAMFGASDRWDHRAETQRLRAARDRGWSAQ